MLKRAPGLVRAVLIVTLVSGTMEVGATPAAQRPDSTATCKAIAAKLASVTLTDCFRRNLRDTQGYSVKGWPILAEEYYPLPLRLPQARVLLIGGIHGDELSSVSIVFKWMKTLRRHHSGLFHWRIVPLMNPDGLLQNEPKRVNANGVDLNRNFPTPDWEKDAQHYWIKRTGRNPRRYPGDSPMSEPETRWLIREVETFKPDVIVAVHAPYGILDFDGHMPAPRRLGSLHLNLLGTYPGSLGNYGVQKNIPVVTIELPSAGIMPSEAEISRIWMDLVRWLRNHVETTREAVHYGADGSDQEAGPS